MAEIIMDTNKKRRKPVLLFLLSLLSALVLTLLLKEPGFTDSQVFVMLLMFFAIGLWLTEAIPAFSVSLLIIAYLVFALGNKNLNSAPEDIAKYVQTFSSSVIWLLLGGFFLATAMTKTRLDQALFRYTLKISGTNPRHLLIGLMSTTMVASMLMSNTATTSMVIASILPLLTSLGKKSGISKALLIGVSMAAATGGIATIIGTPPNAIAVGALQSAGITVNFIDWMLYGFPVTLVVTAIGCFALIRIYIKDTSPISLGFMENHKSEPSKKSSMERNIVIAVTIVTIGLWLTSSFHGLTVASVCAIPLVVLTLTGVLDKKDVQSLPWDVLLLVAGGLSLGIALEHSGLLNHYARKLISMDLNEPVLLAILAFLTMLTSNIMSNTAASTIMIPLSMALLPDLKLEAALIVAISASTAMFLPVSTPPNAIAFSTGLLVQKDFRTGGLIIGIIGPALAILWVLLLS